MKLSDNKLQKLNSLQDQGGFWYITKQNLVFRDLCFIAKILEAWNDDSMQSYEVFFNTHKAMPEYGDLDALVAHRATKNCEYLGLLYTSGNGKYSASNLTPFYYALKKLCNGNFNCLSQYHDLVDKQLERMFIDSSKSDVYKVSFKINPFMFLFKILLLIGDITKSYRISIQEYKLFVATSQSWNDYFEVVESILRYRNDMDYQKNCDVNKSKVADVRMNKLAENHSQLEIGGSDIAIRDGFVKVVRKKVAEYELSDRVESVDDVNNSDIVIDKLPRQQIYYGAPGTGKSHATNEVTSNYPNTIRTTFHPDSDYSTFVGAYKPTMEEVEVKTIPVVVAGGITLEQNKGTYKEKKIVYKFVKQAFLKAYVKAWKLFKETCVKGGELAPQFLVIEEINRGNCAQIFGDLFQLLDRKQKFSEYPIDADADICKALLEEDTEDNPSFGADGLQLTQEQKDFVNQVFERPGESSRNVAEKICNGQVLVLPPNLYIWATMNTSDQSLFPIDSAFKRRWEWKYVRISEGKYKNGHPLNFRIQFTTLEGEKVDESWWEFIQKINEKIEIATKSEDKKLGYFFCKPDKKANETDEQNTIISAETFVGKVVFYLWQDVFKDYGFKSDIFKKEGNARLAFQDFYPNNIEPDEVKNPEGIDLNLVKKFINRVMDKEAVETSTPAPTNSVTE